MTGTHHPIKSYDLIELTEVSTPCHWATSNAVVTQQSRSTVLYLNLLSILCTRFQPSPLLCCLFYPKHFLISSHFNSLCSMNAHLP